MCAYEVMDQNTVMVKSSSYFIILYILYAPYDHAVALMDNSGFFFQSSHQVRTFAGASGRQK